MRAKLFMLISYFMLDNLDPPTESPIGDVSMQQVLSLVLQQINCTLAKSFPLSVYTGCYLQPTTTTIMSAVSAEIASKSFDTLIGMTGCRQLLDTWSVRSDRPVGEVGVGVDGG